MSAEQRYNPQDFARMSLDQRHFRARMPAIVPKVVERFSLDAPTRRIDESPYMERMLGNVKTLWDTGSEKLLYWVYGEYCRNNGLTSVQEVELFGKKSTMNAILSMDDLSPDDLRKWQEYMVSGGVSRRVAVDAFYYNFGFIMPSSLPDLRYQDDTRAEALYRVVESIPYKVVGTVFPDLTDEEAKRLFGQLTPAAEVFKKAEMTPIGGELMPPSINNSNP